jgi:hypothetical protein
VTNIRDWIRNDSNTHLIQIVQSIHQTHQRHEMPINNAEQPGISLGSKFRHLTVGERLHCLIGIARVLEDLCGGGGAAASGRVDGGDFTAIGEDDGLALFHFCFSVHVGRRRDAFVAPAEPGVVDGRWDSGRMASCQYYSRRTGDERV